LAIELRAMNARAHWVHDVEERWTARRSAPHGRSLIALSVVRLAVAFLVVRVTAASAASEVAAFLALADRDAGVAVRLLVLVSTCALPLAIFIWALVVGVSDEIDRRRSGREGNLG